MKASVAEMEAIIENTTREGPHQEEDRAQTMHNFRETFDENAYVNSMITDL